MSDMQITGRLGAITSATSSINGSNVSRSVGFRQVAPPAPAENGLTPGAPVIVLAIEGNKEVVALALGIVGIRSAVAGLISSAEASLNGGSETLATVLSSGMLTLTTAEWNAVLDADSFGHGLEFGASYFLSASEIGKLSRICPYGGQAGGEDPDTDSPNTIAVPVFVGACIGAESATQTISIAIQGASYGDGLTTFGGGLGIGERALRSLAIRTLPEALEGTLAPETLAVAAAYPAGTPLYISAANVGTKAIATSLGHSQVACLLGSAGALGDPAVDGVFAGPLHMVDAAWDAVVDGGAPGGLTPGATYYLSTTAGKITATPPASPNFVIKVGQAQSPNTLIVQIGQAVVGASS